MICKNTGVLFVIILQHITLMIKEYIMAISIYIQLTFIYLKP